MQYKVYVDGQHGTTGLKIHERLAHRTDLELLHIPAEKRRDVDIRRQYLNEADIVFLCLPDVAAREAVALIDNPTTRVLDCSTAHRTADGWVYGLPELGPAHRAKIAGAKRVAVPGCHATGLILALYPLVQRGLVPADYPVTCHSITGYSGGGKELIAQYESAQQAGQPFAGPSPYALNLQHKHLPEMQFHTGLKYPPHFQPIVGNFYSGMAVCIPLWSRLLVGHPAAVDVHAALAAFYAGQRFVRVMPFDASEYLTNGRLDPMACNGTNRAELFVFGHDTQVLVIARFDNLGKGASGAAVQNMNIMLGLDEGTGLA